MKIRLAQQSDASRICDIWNPWITDTAITFTSETKTVAEIQSKIADTTRDFWVAETSDQIQGFVTYGPFRASPGYAHTAEHSIILAPGARGQGIARGLMDALERSAAAAGITVLVAAVSAENAAGVAFHSNAGFIQTGRMPEIAFKFGRKLDLILMQKMITPAV